MNTPLITIITPSYHAAATIRATIDSVLGQTWQPLEYIVIDGGSTDGTVDILKEYGGKIRWTSEPDHGIYDAMNKGIRLAAGDYLLFLGADDTLAAPQTIEQVVKEIQNAGSPDLWCGQVKMFSADTGMVKINGKTLSQVDAAAGEMPPHQGIFARSRSLREHPFNTRYRICADRDFFLWAWFSGKTIRFGDTIVADYGTQGTSNFSFRGIGENLRILREYDPSAPIRRLACKRYAKLTALFILHHCGLLRTVRRLMGRWHTAG